MEGTPRSWGSADYFETCHRMTQSVCLNDFGMVGAARSIGLHRLDSASVRVRNITAVEILFATGMHAGELVGQNIEIAEDSVCAWC
jgi:hypothetical protein